jgi:hypothetical protein
MPENLRAGFWKGVTSEGGAAPGSNEENDAGENEACVADPGVLAPGVPLLGERERGGGKSFTILKTNSCKLRAIS